MCEIPLFKLFVTTPWCQLTKIFILSVGNGNRWIDWEKNDICKNNIFLCSKAYIENFYIINFISKPRNNKKKIKHHNLRVTKIFSPKKKDFEWNLRIFVLTI